MGGGASDDSRSPSLGPFEDLPETVRREVRAALVPRTLAAGGVLCRQGDQGDGMYLLHRGALEIRVAVEAGEVSVDQLHPPAAVGEAALLTGRPRSATVVALEDSGLDFLTAEAFAPLAERHPELLERLEEVVRPRLRRTRLAQVLRTWFGAEDAGAVRRLQDELPWIELAGGEVLFEEGDPADGVYLLLSGRVRLYRAGAVGPEPAGEVGPGESIGELSMLTGTARQVTALALRDSALVFVLGEVTERYPPLMALLARLVAERSRRREAGRGRGRPPRTVGLVPLDPDTPARSLAAALESSLTGLGTTLRIDRDLLAREFVGIDAADAGGGELAEFVLRDWLDRQERAHDHLVYVADPHASPWTERCLRQVDRVVLVARGDADARPRSVERRIADVAPHTPVDLVLVHDDAVARPQGTAAWLGPRRLRLHHHVRLGDTKDAARLARHLTGRAVTLVLSGGGARGYVHIGLLGALAAAGVEVDAVAGTSMGALVGAAFALDRDVAFAERSARAFGDTRKIVDRTLPLVALARSRGFNRILHAMFAEARIEDAWTPFVCVSSNLSRAEPFIHAQGPMWWAVRASGSIPGIFPPVLHDGDVLVDGGVMNNFPVDVARRRFGDGPLIASNAYGRGEREPAYAFGEEVDGWAMLAQRLLPPSRRWLRAPSILATLMRATSLHSHALMESVEQDADLLVRYPTQGVGGLDFDRSDELIALGRSHGERALRDWQSREDPATQRSE